MAEVSRDEMRAVALETVGAALGALGAVGALSTRSPGLAGATDRDVRASARERESITSALLSLEEQEHLRISINGIVHRVRQGKHDFVICTGPGYRGDWWAIEFPPNDPSLIPDLERAASFVRRQPANEWLEQDVHAVIKPLAGPEVGSGFLKGRPCELVMLTTETFRIVAD